MKHTRLLLSLIAFVGASGILIVSLFSVSLVQSSDGTTNATTKEFYFSNDILPDHIGYPLLMISDRVRLESAPAQERVFMQVEYGFRRLDSAKSLLSQGKSSLAVTTLTKSAKYLQQAALEAQQYDAGPSVSSHVVKALEFFDKDVRRMLDQLPEQDRSAIERLLQENQAIATSLR